jgi:hypothetical protein
MKTHKDQRLWTTLSSPAIPCGATHQGTHHGVCGADACAVTCHGATHSDVGLQALENTALSQGITGKSALILADITIRKNQDTMADHRRSAHRSHPP